MIDPMKARAKGFSAQQLAGMIYTTMVGSDATDVTIDNKEYTIKVEYPDGLYENMNAVSNMYYTNTSGRTVMLDEMAEIVYTDSPQTIHRDNGQYASTLTVNMVSDNNTYNIFLFII